MRFLSFTLVFLSLTITIDAGKKPSSKDESSMDGYSTNDHVAGNKGKDPDWCSGYKQMCQFESIRVECRHTCNVTTAIEPSWCASYKQFCNYKAIHESCPVSCVTAIDGNWGEWSQWGDCSATCDQGHQKRHRTCNHPAPLNGGKACAMANGTHAHHEEEIRDCFSNLCPINGGYGNWTGYSACSQSCGTGVQYRYRCCTNPMPKFGGDDCSTIGDPVEPRDCNIMPCPVNGNYGNWTAWGTCSKTCGGGEQLRTRTCDNPAPQHGGSDCSTLGEASEKQACNAQPCPVDGGYADFSPFSTCSKSCGGGLQYRMRCCDNPKPAFGGKPCIVLGEPVEIKTCEEQPCPIDGNWGEWGTFGACSHTCGDVGVKVRTRTCDNPAAQHGGKACPGDSSESEECERKPCPVNGGLTEWTDWTSCSSTCGTSVQTRDRTCTNPTPAHGGDSCVGALNESKTCLVPQCTVLTFGTTPLSWDDAEQACNGQGGHLATIQDEAEMTTIVAEFEKLGVQPASNKYIWIGLNDKDTAGVYKWTDGSSLGFTNWGSGEPSHVEHHCVSINFATKTWWDRNCPTLYHYVCEKAVDNLSD